MLSLFFFPSSLTKGTRIFSAEFVKKVTEERNCSVSVALSLISFGFLNYVIDENEEQEGFQQRLQQKRTCNPCGSAHATKQTPPQTDTHTQGAGGGGGGKERERERERVWSVGTLGRLAGR